MSSENKAIGIMGYNLLHAAGPNNWPLKGSYRRLLQVDTDLQPEIRDH